MSFTADQSQKINYRSDLELMKIAHAFWRIVKQSAIGVGKHSGGSMELMLIQTFHRGMELILRPEGNAFE